MPHLEPKRSIRINNMGASGQTNLLWAAFGVPTSKTVSTSFISRMYSAQLPHHSITPELLGVALEKELAPTLVPADDDFIDLMFPHSRSPITEPDNDVVLSLSQTIGQRPALWDDKSHVLTLPAFTEKGIAAWLNHIGEYLEQLVGHKPLRRWSHRNCDTPPVGACIKRKPDVILLDDELHTELEKNPSKPTDWCFIRSFAEVTKSPDPSRRLIDTVNAKTYLSFLCQPNRRFAIALSFTGGPSFTLKITDREGQIWWSTAINSGRNKKHVGMFLRILAFLMFGTLSDIGLDPNVHIDRNGNCTGITVGDKLFAVEKIIYKLESVVGRGTQVWIVSHDGATYTLKDCWIQDRRVDSEVSMLEKISTADKLKNRVPGFFCGGDVEIDGEVDCTGQYREELTGPLRSLTRRTHRRLVCTPIGESLISFRSKKEFINIMKSIITSALFIIIDKHCEAHLSF